MNSIVARRAARDWSLEEELCDLLRGTAAADPGAAGSLLERMDRSRATTPPAKRTSVAGVGGMVGPSRVIAPARPDPTRRYQA